MHCARPRDYHSLGLIRIQFHPPKVTKLTNLDEVTTQGLCTTVTLTPGDGTTAFKAESSVKPISLFSGMEKSSDVYRRNNNGPKTLPCGAPHTLTSLLRQPSTIRCCDRFDRYCANIDNTEPPIPTEQTL